MKTFIRLTKEEREKVKEVAQKLGYSYNQEGSISHLCRAIAEGDLILVKKNS